MSQQKINNYTFEDKAINDLEELFDLANPEKYIKNPRKHAREIRNELNWYRALLQYLETWIEISGKEIEGTQFKNIDVQTTKQFWVKDQFYRSSYWRERRKEIINRDNKKCRKCGLTQEEQRKQGKSKRGLEVHHIKKRLSFSKQERQEGGCAHDKDNLATLCTKCHAKLEQKPITKQKEILDMTH